MVTYSNRISIENCIEFLSFCFILSNRILSSVLLNRISILLFFYYPKLLHCLNQMLAVVLVSQDRVSSSKTVRPHAPCGARCIVHAISTWSAVCSEAPHSQFGEGARSHLFMDEWNRPTPVRRRLSLTQAACRNPIPTCLEPVPGTKTRSLEAFLQYSAFHL